MTFAVHNANTLRRTHFMAGEYKEVAIQSLYVDFLMRRRLRTVEDNHSTYVMSTFDELRNREFHAQYVTYMRKGDNLRMFVDFIHFAVFNMTAFVEVHVFQRCARYMSDTLPCYQVCMVFRNGDDDFIAFLHIVHTIAKSD